MNEPVYIGDATLYTGDVLEVLRSLPSESVHCIVSSPPYWGLRDYGIEPSVWPSGWRGAHGLEPTPELYVAHEVTIWREARRVLRSDGTAWVNLGDSYAGSGCGWGGGSFSEKAGHFEKIHGVGAEHKGRDQTPPAGCKAKDLVGIPEQFALALRADGWYWRSRIPWIKRNCMPESCKDRPATAVESVMLFSKSSRYYYDNEAIKMRTAGTAHARGDGVNPKAKVPSGWDQENHGRQGNGRFRPRQNESFSGSVKEVVSERNRRNSDWFMESWQGLLSDENGEPLALVVNTQPYKAAHFATFPPRLVRPMILAGCPEGGTVLDPFGGSGTTAAVALEYGRRAILIERKPEYMELARRRVRPVAGRPLLAFGGTA